MFLKISQRLQACSSQRQHTGNYSLCGLKHKHVPVHHSDTGSARTRLVLTMVWLCCVHFKPVSRHTISVTLVWNVHWPGRPLANRLQCSRCPAGEMLAWDHCWRVDTESADHFLAGNSSWTLTQFSGVRKTCQEFKYASSQNSSLWLLQCLVKGVFLKFPIQFKDVSLIQKGN